MPWLERWTRNGDRLEPVEVSEEEAERADGEPYDESSNIAHTRIRSKKPE